MQVSEAEWTQAEKQLAHEIFQRAYEREAGTLIKTVSEKVEAIEEVDDLWNLHDFLSAKRHELDGKYDYRYSVLIFVFAQLVKEGWLQPEELNGLSPDKRSKVVALSRM